jgi:hypothetical protein
MVSFNSTNSSSLPKSVIDEVLKQSEVEPEYTKMVEVELLNLNENLINLTNISYELKIIEGINANRQFNLLYSKTKDESINHNAFINNLIEYEKLLKKMVKLRDQPIFINGLLDNTYNIMGHCFFLGYNWSQYHEYKKEYDEWLDSITIDDSKLEEGDTEYIKLIDVYVERDNAYMMEIESIICVLRYIYKDIDKLLSVERYILTHEPGAVSHLNYHKFTEQTLEKPNPSPFYGKLVKYGENKSIVHVNGIPYWRYNQTPVEYDTNGNPIKLGFNGKPIKFDDNGEPIINVTPKFITLDTHTRKVKLRKKHMSKRQRKKQAREEREIRKELASQSKKAHEEKSTFKLQQKQPNVINNNNELPNLVNDNVNHTPIESPKYYENYSKSGTHISLNQTYEEINIPVTSYAEEIMFKLLDEYSFSNISLNDSELNKKFDLLSKIKKTLIESDGKSVINTKHNAETDEPKENISRGGGIKNKMKQILGITSFFLNIQSIHSITSFESSKNAISETGIFDIYKYLNPTLLIKDVKTTAVKPEEAKIMVNITKTSNPPKSEEAAIQDEGPNDLLIVDETKFNRFSLLYFFKLTQKFSNKIKIKLGLLRDENVIDIDKINLLDMLFSKSIALKEKYNKHTFTQTNVERVKNLFTLKIETDADSINVINLNPDAYGEWNTFGSLLNQDDILQLINNASITTDIFISDTTNNFKIWFLKILMSMIHENDLIEDTDKQLTDDNFRGFIVINLHKSMLMERTQKSYLTKHAIENKIRERTESTLSTFNLDELFPPTDLDNGINLYMRANMFVVAYNENFIPKNFKNKKLYKKCEGLMSKIENDVKQGATATSSNLQQKKFQKGKNLHNTIDGLGPIWLLSTSMMTIPQNIEIYNDFMGLFLYNPKQSYDDYIHTLDEFKYNTKELNGSARKFKSKIGNKLRTFTNEYPYTPKYGNLDLIEQQAKVSSASLEEGKTNLFQNREESVTKVISEVLNAEIKTQIEKGEFIKVHELIMKTATSMYGSTAILGKSLGDDTSVKIKALLLSKLKKIVPKFATILKACKLAFSLLNSKPFNIDVLRLNKNTKALQNFKNSIDPKENSIKTLESAAKTKQEYEDNFIKLLNKICNEELKKNNEEANALLLFTGTRIMLQSAYDNSVVVLDTTKSILESIGQAKEKRYKEIVIQQAFTNSVIDDYKFNFLQAVGLYAMPKFKTKTGAEFDLSDISQGTRLAKFLKSNYPIFLSITRNIPLKEVLPEVTNETSLFHKMLNKEKNEIVSITLKSCWLLLLDILKSGLGEILVPCILISFTAIGGGAILFALAKKTYSQFFKFTVSKTEQFGDSLFKIESNNRPPPIQETNNQATNNFFQKMWSIFRKKTPENGTEQASRGGELDTFYGLIGYEPSVVRRGGMLNPAKRSIKNKYRKTKNKKLKLSKQRKKK